MFYRFSDMWTFIYQCHLLSQPLSKHHGCHLKLKSILVKYLEVLKYF